MNAKGIVDTKICASYMSSPISLLFLVTDGTSFCDSGSNCRRAAQSKTLAMQNVRKMEEVHNAIFAFNPLLGESAMMKPVSV
jgi:hypothetical protein